MPYLDRDRLSRTDEPAASEVAVVTECAFCHSTRVSTTSKTVTEATYWRCLACGEIWNPSRAVAANRRGGRGW